MKKLLVALTFIVMSQFLTGCVSNKKMEPSTPFSARRLSVSEGMTMSQVTSAMMEDPDQIISSNNHEIWIYESEVIEAKHPDMKRVQSFSVRFKDNKTDYLGYFSCYIPANY